MTEYGDRFAAAVAEELRAQKARVGKTNDEIGEEVGVSPVTVLRYLKGQRQIPVDVLGDLCKALGADAGIIMQTAHFKASLSPVASAASQLEKVIGRKIEVEKAAYRDDNKRAESGRSEDVD